VRKKGHLEIQYNKWKWSEDWWIVSGDGKGHEVNWGFGTKGGLRWVSRAPAGGERYRRLSNLAAILSIIILLSLLSFGQLG
jgi:hypothetical protein